MNPTQVVLPCRSSRPRVGVRLASTSGKLASASGKPASASGKSTSASGKSTSASDNGKKEAPPMTAYVSLFRSINVGGNQVKMDDLKEMHEALGLRDVLPYIRSGNVVFTSDDADQLRLQRLIEENFAIRFGFHAEVFVRTPAELGEIIENNPFQSHTNKESKWITVMFLADHPDEQAYADLIATYAGPEEFFLIDKALYIYYTNGIGRSKLSHSFLEKKLKTVGTVRNWNTILQLQKLLQ